MSLVLKEELSSLEIVVGHLRRSRLLWDPDTELQGSNRDFMIDLLSVTAAIWIDVSHSSLVNKRWVDYVCSQPVLRFVEMLKDVDYQLIAEKQQTFSTFKQWLKASYGDWGRQILAPLTSNLCTFFSCAGDLQRIRTALRFATRANLPECLSLESEAYEAWRERSSVVWSGVQVDREARELERIFPRLKGWYQDDSLVGQFGPGASAYVRGTHLAAKYADFRYDYRLAYCAVKYGHPVSDLPIGFLDNRPGFRVGKLAFAPKWLDKLRVISMSPASLMYYQLGGFDLIMRKIRRSPWSANIDLEHAELNAQLALSGSLGGGYSTIDLSDASDCVRLELVARLTRNTCLRELLLCTRESAAEYDGVLYYPTYYAPMGNGLCFPVECIVFASVVSAIMRRHNDRRAWRVFGDDIIVPDDRYDEVVARLVDLGFKVNLEKSFTGAMCFRESCGGDYFSGEDVRPVYVSRFWTGLPVKGGRQSGDHVTKVESSISLANRLAEYRLARLWVVRALLKAEPGILFTEGTDKGLYSPRPSNYHLKERYNEGLQRIEYKTVRYVRSQQETSQSEELLRYYEWHRQRARSPMCMSESTLSIGRTSAPQLRWVWDAPSPGWIAPIPPEMVVGRETG